MRYVLTPAEMADADRAAIAAGTPEATLVERAGNAVAWAVRRLLGGVYGRRAVVVCGKGNNGADGRVAARVLRHWGVGVDEFPITDDIDRTAFQRALARADVLVDAMFGTGFRGALDGAPAWVAGRVQRTNVPVVAVDIPSGVDGLTGRAQGPAVRAALTVCFAGLKPGLLFEPGRFLAGDIEVVDIGIDARSATEVWDAADVQARIGTRLRWPLDHKWSSAVMVVAGSTGMTGAALMTSHAAARCGAGMVVCGVPGADTAALASGTEVVVRALPATAAGVLAEDAADAVLDSLGRFNALAIGPGLGRDHETQRAVRRILAEARCPVVIDADALNAAAGGRALARRRDAGLVPAVLTPHAGEYERLAGRPVGDDRLAAARRLALDTGAVVLLKGPGTVVVAPDGAAVVNATDDARLATAGTGDVLTGMIGGFLAQNKPAAEAAACAAWLHGMAARAAGTGDSLVASDLIAALPRTLAQLQKAGPED
jgi:NAD(P)H-hydrate epimerase